VFEVCLVLLALVVTLVAAIKQIALHTNTEHVLNAIALLSSNRIQQNLPTLGRIVPESGEDLRKPTTLQLPKLPPLNNQTQVLQHGANLPAFLALE